MKKERETEVGKPNRLKETYWQNVMCEPSLDHHPNKPIAEKLKDIDETIRNVSNDWILDYNKKSLLILLTYDNRFISLYLWVIF